MKRLNLLTAIVLIIVGLLVAYVPDRGALALVLVIGIPLIADLMAQRRLQEYQEITRNPQP